MVRYAGSPLGARIETGEIVDDAVTTAKILDDAVTTAKILADNITNALIADDQIDSEHYVDGSIDTVHVGDNQINLAKLEHGTQGDILYYGATGTPSRLGFGTVDHVLKTKGTGADPVWEAASGGVSGEGHLTLFGTAYNTIGQGTWANEVLTSCLYNIHFHNNTGAADGDNFTIQAYMDAGTYTLRIVAYAKAAAGILDVDIAGGEVASFDLYSAGADYAKVFTQTSINVGAAGLKTLTFRCDGKNGSSSNHQIGISFIAFWRTA